jgi:hypothetical protein
MIFSIVWQSTYIHTFTYRRHLFLIWHCQSSDGPDMYILSPTEETHFLCDIVNFLTVYYVHTFTYIRHSISVWHCPSSDDLDMYILSPVRDNLCLTMIIVSQVWHAHITTYSILSESARCLSSSDGLIKYIYTAIYMADFLLNVQLYINVSSF